MKNLFCLFIAIVLFGSHVASGDARTQNRDADLTGSILEVHGRAYLKDNATAKEVVLSPKRDRDRLLYAGQMLRCDQGGYLILLINQEAKSLASSMEWYVVPRPTRPDTFGTPAGPDEAANAKSGGRRSADIAEVEKRRDEARRLDEARRSENDRSRAENTAGLASGPPSLPKADEIIERYVQALGGKVAIEKQNSRVARGTFEIAAFGATGAFESISKAPNKNVTVIDVASFGVVREGFDGKVAWAQDPQNGLREKTGAELAAAKLDGDFYRNVNLKQLYTKIVVTRKETFGFTQVYVVEATPAEGSSETWYFDVRTGLLLRVDTEREGPQGKQVVHSFLDNYREVDGIKLPFTLKQVTPTFTINIKFEEVKHGVAIEDAKFNKPAAQ